MCGDKGSFSTYGQSDCESLAKKYKAGCFVLQSETAYCWLRRSCTIKDCRHDVDTTVYTYKASLSQSLAAVAASSEDSLAGSWSETDETNCWPEWTPTHTPYAGGHGGINCHKDSGRMCGDKGSFSTYGQSDCESLAKKYKAGCFVLQSETAYCWLRRSCTIKDCRHDVDTTVYTYKASLSQSYEDLRSWSEFDETNCWPEPYAGGHDGINCHGKSTFGKQCGPKLSFMTTGPSDCESLAEAHRAGCIVMDESYNCWLRQSCTIKDCKHEPGKTVYTLEVDAPHFLQASTSTNETSTPQLRGALRGTNNRHEWR